MTSASAESDLLMLMVSFKRSLSAPAPDELRRSDPAKSTALSVGPSSLATPHPNFRSSLPSQWKDHKCSVDKFKSVWLTKIQHSLALLARQRVHTLHFERKDRMRAGRALIHERRSYRSSALGAIQQGLHLARIGQRDCWISSHS